jgi:uncharacterized membrane protein HdeD (DUF308 family)
VTETTQEHVNHNVAFLVILGFFLAMFGLMAIVAPLVVGLAVELIVGILLLGRGSMQLYYGIKVRHWGPGLVTYLGVGSILMALLSVACGALLIAWPLTGLRYLILLLAGYLTVTGCFDVLHAIELRAVRGWGILLLNGLAGIALGWLIWRQWPISGEWAIGVLTGANMFFSGISLAALGRVNRKIESFDSG